MIAIAVLTRPERLKNLFHDLVQFIHRVASRADSQTDTHIMGERVHFLPKLWLFIRDIGCVFVASQATSCWL